MFPQYMAKPAVTHSLKHDVLIRLSWQYSQ